MYTKSFVCLWGSKVSGRDFLPGAASPGALVGNPRKCGLAKVTEMDGIKTSLGSGHVSGPSPRSWAGR